MEDNQLSIKIIELEKRVARLEQDKKWYLSPDKIRNPYDLSEIARMKKK